MDRERAMKSLCLTLACCMVASFATTEPKNSKTPSPADARRQVLDLGKEWVAAENKQDAATLRRILDDKFVASFGAKKPLDKEAFIKHIVSGDVDPTASQTLTDETVIIDHDTAIVVGTDTVRGTDNGTAYAVVYRYTVTYIRRHEQWVALAEHLVEAPQTK
jgi:ketosteroid isomerase-like protein